jgi:hypothetical protein
MGRRPHPSRHAGLGMILILSSLPLLLQSGAQAHAALTPSPGRDLSASGPVNVQVTAGHLNHGTVPLVVDPLDPDRLLTATTFHRFWPPCLAAVTSNDGGMTWSRRPCMTWDGSFRPEEAPTVAFGADGSIYLAAIYWSPLKQRERVEVERSTDGGATWSRPVPVVTEFGPPPRYLMVGVRIAVDLNPGSPFFGRLYVAAEHDNTDFGDEAITVSVSSDGGATWATPGKIIDVGLNSDPHFAFGTDGTVFVTYAACKLYSGLSCKHLIYLELQCSSDGGMTWGGERRISIVYARAQSTTYERLQKGNGPSFALSPAIAVDDSTGPHAGRLYEAQVVWTRWHLRLELRHSNDQGDSWSTPVQVAPPVGQHDQFMPSLSVSATGVLGVGWLDRRDDPGNVLYRTYQAFSTDGGRTFTGVGAVATAGSNPYLWNSISEAACVWAGDRLDSAWPDTRTGSIQLEVGWTP